MRASVIVVLLSQTLACTAQPPPQARTAPARPLPAAGPRPARATGALSRTFSGQERPSLTVTSQFHRVQHVFIDWVHEAALAPGKSVRFELEPGTHTITCADSHDPDDNPATVTEAFQTGFAYDYVISQL